MSRIKIIAFYLAIIFFYGCGARKATVTKQDFDFQATSRISEKAPGIDFPVVLPAPLRERPRSETKVYTGEKGVKTFVSFNDKGIVTNILTSCPEIDVIKEENEILKATIKEKETQREEAVGWKTAGVLFLFGLIIGLVVGFKLAPRLKIFG